MVKKIKNFAIVVFLQKNPKLDSLRTKMLQIPLKGEGPTVLYLKKIVDLLIIFEAEMA